MRNPKPNTAGIVEHQFTPESARKAARASAEKRAAGEPLVVTNVKIYERQKREIIRRGENLSALMRRLLDEHLSQ